MTETIVKNSVICVVGSDWASQPYPAGSIKTLNGIRRKNHLYLAVPHLNKIQVGSIRENGGTAPPLFYSDGALPNSLATMSVDYKSDSNNNFLFDNYFMAWAYVQKWRLVNPGWNI